MAGTRSLALALLFTCFGTTVASEFDLSRLSITRDITDEGSFFFKLSIELSNLYIFVPRQMCCDMLFQTPGTTEVNYFYNGEHISPWHDIPIRSSSDADDKIVNFVCEIPKGTTAKNEIHKSAPYNSVLQDRKNGKPRFYKYGDSIVNYGAIPQTWEDPKFISEETGFGGDNDPIGISIALLLCCFIFMPTVCSWSIYLIFFHLIPIHRTNKIKITIFFDFMFVDFITLCDK
jgi:hypothetical protein